MSNQISSSNSGVVRQSIGFLLLDQFTLISLASAIEPLRMANQLSGRDLYHWVTLTERGESVSASDGLYVTPDLAMESAQGLDTVIVCGGISPDQHISPRHLAWLKRQAKQSRRLGAICTGAWALAKAGLLNGYDISTHWECMAAMKESFPKVGLTNRLFSNERDRATASGGTAPLDMMLNLISRDHSRDLAAGISEMFVCERIRTENDMQRIPLRHLLGTAQPKLLDAVALMEANLEEPLSQTELADFIGVSRRQLERLFQKNLDCSPSRYYLKLRLTHARQLIRQTSLSIIDVAAASGFISTPHFSKCYREFFGVPPRDERRLDQGRVQPVWPNSHGHLAASA